MRRFTLLYLFLGSTAFAQGSWMSVGQGLAGVGGQIPAFVASGALVSGGSVTLSLSNAARNSTLLLLVSLTSQPTPFSGGTIVAYPVAAALPATTDNTGAFSLTAVCPPLPDGMVIYAQCLVADPAAILGTSISNGLKAATSLSLPSGASAWWPGDTFNDIAPHTPPDAPHDGFKSSAGPSLSPTGFIGGCYHFTGLFDNQTYPLMQVDAVGGLSLFMQPRSIEFWIRLEPDPNNIHLTQVAFHLGSVSQTIGGNAFVVYAKKPNKIGGGSGVGRLGFSGNGPLTDFYTESSIDDGLWHHVAVTYQFSNLKIYRDGVSVQIWRHNEIPDFYYPVGSPESGADCPINTNFNTLAIGGSGLLTGGTVIVGDIDEMTYYNVALSPSEVFNIYLAGDAGKVKP